MKDHKIVIMGKWIEPIQENVPDEEQGRVYNYIFAEYLRIGYGIPHELTKPDGAGGMAISYIIPQVENMCSTYAEIEEKRKQNLIRANEAKAAYKQGRQPPAGESVCEQVCANPYARAEADFNDEPPHTHTHTCGENANAVQMQCNNNNNNHNNNHNNNRKITMNPQPKKNKKAEREIYKIGLEVIDRGKIVGANMLRNVYYEALTKARTIKPYIIACFRVKYESQSDAHIIANLLRAADIGSPDCLEVYEIFVENEICTITCTEKTYDCIEKNAEKFLQPLNNIGARQLHYRVVGEYKL